MFVRKDKDGNLVGVGSIDYGRLAQLQGAKRKSAKAAESKAETKTEAKAEVKVKIHIGHGHGLLRYGAGRVESGRGGGRSTEHHAACQACTRWSVAGGVEWITRIKIAAQCARGIPFWTSALREIESFLR